MKVGLRGQALPALGPAALENRTAGACRHAGTETVPALPPAHVGLVGPFHEVEKSRKNAPGGAVAGQYRQAVVHSVIHSSEVAKCLQM